MNLNDLNKDKLLEEQNKWTNGENNFIIDVVELWKNENENTFIMFGTAERANKLNELYKSNKLNEFI